MQEKRRPPPPHQSPPTAAAAPREQAAARLRSPGGPFRPARTPARWAVLASALLGSAGCGGRDITDLTLADGRRPGAAGQPDPAAGAPPAPGAPGAPWVNGLPARPDVPLPATFPARLDVAAAGWTVVDAFPALAFDDPVFLAEAPGTGQLFVAEREGRLYAFPNDPAATDKHLVLDLSGRTQGDNDSGLLGFAFHPELGQPGSPNAAFVYLHYALNPDPISGDVPERTATHSRLARFELDLATLTIDPATELVLIDQEDQSVWHQGGALFFHPVDGFLYLAVGDEGSARCQLGNCQRLDNDLFSGVLRIDVDQRGGAISHPIPRQPATGTTANYFIPNDNPFVGQPGVLEEFYALGLRSPHRMTHDPVDDIVWIGEVGQGAREELNVLSPAANYQWNVLEGTLPSTAPMPEPPLGVWTDPVLELGRGEAGSIIGGYVYRGDRLPQLYGKYIFGDFVTGNLWALDYDYDGERAAVLGRELLARTPFRNRRDGLTSFGVDQRGELYLLTLGAAARIWRLGITDAIANVPRRLSETQLFADTTSPTLEPHPALLPYDVQSPLWSDGAAKARWLALPPGTAATYAETGSWTFPVGSLFIKHFELALDERRPDQRRRLETRVLVHGEGGEYYGVTYKWNAEQTDADLLLESLTEPLDVTLADGDRRHLEYSYPAPADCGVCHNAAAGPVLGVRTNQLNAPRFYSESGLEANQVFTLGRWGLIEPAPDAARLEALPALAGLRDAEASLEWRVRSYWESNCSMCHRGAESEVRALWDARIETPLAEQGVLWGEALSSVGEGFLVVPGDPERSVLFQRSAAVEVGVRMPPVGRSVGDGGYVDALSEWIAGL